MGGGHEHPPLIVAGVCVGSMVRVSSVKVSPHHPASRLGGRADVNFENARTINYHTPGQRVAAPGQSKVAIQGGKGGGVRGGCGGAPRGEARPFLRDGAQIAHGHIALNTRKKKIYTTLNMTHRLLRYGGAKGLLFFCATKMPKVLLSDRAFTPLNFSACKKYLTI